MALGSILCDPNPIFFFKFWVEVLLTSMISADQQVGKEWMGWENSHWVANGYHPNRWPSSDIATWRVSPDVSGGWNYTGHVLEEVCPKGNHVPKVNTVWMIFWLIWEPQVLTGIGEKAPKLRVKNPSAQDASVKMGVFLKCGIPKNNRFQY